MSDTQSIKKHRRQNNLLNENGVSLEKEKKIGGLGVGGWGIGVGGLGQIPNPQSPIPNPQSPKKIKK